MEDDAHTTAQDLFLTLVGVLLVLMLLMIFSMNPPTKASEVDGVNSPGNVIVEASWGDSLDADVDLWVMAPGDVSVGYSNKAGRIFNLLRDDLGRAQDVTDYNHETAYSRGTPAGEYVVNLHMYRGVGVTYPVQVKIVVSIKLTPDSSSRQIVSTTVELKREGQELTAVRFRLDEAGQLVPESLHSLFKPLRAAKS